MNISQLAGHLVEQAKSETEKSVQQATNNLNTNDVAKFKEAMQNPEQLADIQSSSMHISSIDTPAASAQQPQKAELSSSLGDQILNTMSEMQESHNDLMNKVKDSVDGNASMSTSELLQTQMQLQKMMLTQELVGKGAAKATQHVNTLLNNK